MRGEKREVRRGGTVEGEEWKGRTTTGCSAPFPTSHFSSPPHSASHRLYSTMPFDPEFASILPRTAVVRDGRLLARRLRCAGVDARVRIAALRLRRDGGARAPAASTSPRSRRATPKRQSHTRRRRTSAAGWRPSRARRARARHRVRRRARGRALGGLSRRRTATSTATTSGEDELREAIDAGVGRDHRRQLPRARAARPRWPRAIGKRAADHPAPLARRRCAHARARRRRARSTRSSACRSSTGAAEQAVVEAQRLAGVDLVGLHCHLGSPLFELEPYDEANAVMLAFAAEMRAKHGFELREYSPGGGFAVAVRAREARRRRRRRYADAIVVVVPAPSCEEHGLAAARASSIEPGRSIVGRARRGAVHRRLAQGDSRPAHVGLRRWRHGRQHPPGDLRRRSTKRSSRTGADDDARRRVTIAGKYCESGDILVRTRAAARSSPATSSRCRRRARTASTMASNYNMALKPAVVVVGDGSARSSAAARPTRT